MSTTAIYEIAPDLFRLSIYVPDFDMQFNHFLVRDEEPLLFHAGLKGMFPELREAVAKIIDPAKLRHIAWSHFESDEIGALNDWLLVAPEAQPVCTLIGKLVSVDDFSVRPARGMTPEDVLTTGKYRYRFYRSPHIPHGWDAGVLFEETSKTLFCSDLFHHFGNVEPVTTSDLIGPTRKRCNNWSRGHWPATCLTLARLKVFYVRWPTSSRQLWPSCTDLPIAENAMACSSTWPE